MGLFHIFKQKNSTVLSRHITAVDGRVIARQGQTIDSDFDSKNGMPEPEGFHTYTRLMDTPISFHFANLLKEEKYQSFIGDEITRKEIETVFGMVEVNHPILRELEWLRRYDYFYHHMMAICLLVIRLALDYWSEAERARTAAFCALTHDLGITRVPETILDKVGPLEPGEMKILREHPLYSFVLISYYLGDSNHLNARIALEHHEDPLGSGYPRGIRRNDILIQMIKISDIFDALITNRPFRPALSFAEALATFEQDVESGRVIKDLPILLRSYIFQGVMEAY